MTLHPLLTKPNNQHQQTVMLKWTNLFHQMKATRDHQLTEVGQCHLQEVGLVLTLLQVAALQSHPVKTEVDLHHLLVVKEVDREVQREVGQGHLPQMKVKEVGLALLVVVLEQEVVQGQGHLLEVGLEVLPVLKADLDLEVLQEVSLAAQHEVVQAVLQEVDRVAEEVDQDQEVLEVYVADQGQEVQLEVDQDLVLLQEVGHDLDHQQEAGQGQVLLREVDQDLDHQLEVGLEVQIVEEIGQGLGHQLEVTEAEVDLVQGLVIEAGRKITIFWLM